MENITRYVFLYFNILVCILAAGIVGLGLWLHSKKKWAEIMLLIAFKQLGIICIILFFVVNLFQLPYYSNAIADGRRIEEDSIKIANYLMEDETHTDIYYVTTESDRYERAVYAYLNEKIIYVSREKVNELNDKEAIVIVSSKCDLGEKFQEIKLSTEVLDIMELKQ